MIGYIEKAMDTKDTVIGAFVDIEGGFNSTTRTTIDRALSKYRIPNTIRRWIMETLNVTGK